MRPRHQRLATLDEASSGGRRLSIDVSILRLLVAAAAVLGGLFAVAAFASPTPSPAPSIQTSPGVNPDGRGADAHTRSEASVG